MKEILFRLRNQGACHISRHKAQKTIEELESLLEPTEYLELQIALNHCDLEGCEEFFDKIKQLETKYIAS